MANLSLSGLDPFQKEFAKLAQANATRYRLHEVFRDFCELAALTLSNTVDRLHYDRREARYMEIIKRYSPEEVHRFPMMLAAVVNSLEGGFGDSLGQLFMALELGDQWKGQFFTPYEISLLMAKMTLGDVPATVEQNGFFTVMEPCVGAGAMVIAMAQAVHDAGTNYQQCMHVTAIDLDSTAVHMAYIQFSLLHIPAIVVHGNTLAMTEWDHWVTPAHVLGLWDGRLQNRRLAANEAADLDTPTTESPPPAPASDVCAVVVKQRIEKTEQLGLFA